MVDALVSGASVERRAGSSPVLGTENVFCIIRRDGGIGRRATLRGVVTIVSWEFESPSLHFHKRLVCGNSSVGRARPCQGRGREFESCFPAQAKLPVRVAFLLLYIPVSFVFFVSFTVELVRVADIVPDAAEASGYRDRSHERIPHPNGKYRVLFCPPDLALMESL